jgi:myo-inositol 2-dehydrogenase / D-chiro-inositol 1-dehydrogenase
MRCTSAFQAIEHALATNQIGTPVSVRLIAHLAEDSNKLSELAASLQNRVASWLDDTIVSSNSIGDETMQTSHLVRTAKGRSALISSGVCLDDPLVEVVLFGSQGVLSWEAIRGQESFTEDQLSVREDPSPKKTPDPLLPPYGVLLVSGDHTHQPSYAEALLADDRCTLIGVTDEEDVSDSRRELNQRLADRLSIPMLPNLGDALARSDVHIVSICAEPFRRGRIIAAAARAGKHLYLDKPFVGSIEDIDIAAKAIRDAGVVAHMFTQVHWDPAQRVRASIESGELGELGAIHCDVCFAKGRGGAADLSRPRVEQEVPAQLELPDAKRELTNIGVYPIAMLLWLLGQDVKRVHAATGNFFFSEHQAQDMEDFGQMLLEFEGGTVATISAGRVGWQSHPNSGLHRVCLVGTKTSITIDAHRPRVEVWSDADPWTPPPRDPDDPMGMWAPLPSSSFVAAPKHAWILPNSPSWSVDTKHFLDCIEQGHQSDVSVDIAAASSEILFAAYRSAANNGTAIELSPPR